MYSIGSNPFLDFEHFDLCTSPAVSGGAVSNNAILATLKRDPGLLPEWCGYSGYLVPEFYRLPSERRCQPNSGIFYHNENDVLSLLALFNLLSEILENQH